MKLTTAACSLLLFLAPAALDAQGLVRVEKSDQARRGWLGISVEGEASMPPQVVEVVPESPAAKGGVRVGDVILKVDGAAAGDIDEFIARVRGYRAGNRVRLTVRRGDAQRTLSCTLGVHPDQRRADKPAATKPKAQPKVPGGPGFLGIELTEDFEILSVIPGTAAQKAGLKNGDVIVLCQGQKPKSLEGLVKSIQAAGAGNELKLTVRRGGNDRDIAVKLGARAPTPGGIARLRDLPDAEIKKLESEIRKLESEISKVESQLGKSTATKPKAPAKDTKREPERKTTKKAPSKPAKKPAPKSDQDWLTNLDAAKRMSRRSGKPIVVDFYADWCKPCKMLEQSFANGKVERVLSRAIPVRIDVDKQGRLADSFGVSTIPHVVALDRSGKKLGEFTGYLPAEMLAERLGGILGKAAPAKTDRPSDRRPERAARAAAKKRAAAAQRKAAEQAAAKVKAGAKNATKQSGSNDAALRRAIRDVARSQQELNERLERLLKLLERMDRDK